ncbi:MAG: hypothetical protein ACI4HI_11515 [Lachnospiraceae bacterium]
MSYCTHEKRKHYKTEIENWKKGYLNFIKSKEPWKYDFKKGNEGYTEKTDCEQSILSQLIFVEVFNKQKLSAEICESGKSIKVGKNKVEKIFLFDIMHNPKSGCQPCQQAVLYKYNNGKMKFEDMYHCVGNFAPVPRTIIANNYGPRLQQIHEYLNELWPCFLKFMQDNWLCFPTDVSELMSFKEYMKYSCQQMYFEDIFNKLYDIYNDTNDKEYDKMWEKILDILSSAVIDQQDKLISFDDLFRKHNIKEIDNRILFLIELRGRFILSLLKS